MKMFRAFLLSLCLLVKLQAQDSILIKDALVDSLWYQNTHNFFSYDDEQNLLGYNLLEQSNLSNLGLPIINWYETSRATADLFFGDASLAFLRRDVYKPIDYHQPFPHTKIIYTPAFNEGQRINFTHLRSYKNGALEIAYDRLSSLGFMFHEKNKYTKFSFRGSYQHPSLPYKSDWRVRSFKNESEWNGGVSNDSLFVSGEESNWELLPVNWANTKTLTKHKDIVWRHHYKLTSKSNLSYRLNVEEDSMFYEGLEDDSLFFPSRLDSTSNLQYRLLSSKHTLAWKQDLNKDRKLALALNYQHFKVDESEESQLLLSANLWSKDLKNKFHLTYELFGDDDHVFISSYEQTVFLFGIENKFKLAFEKKNHDWLLQNTNRLYPSNPTPMVLAIKQSVEQSFVWELNLGEGLSLKQSYRNIDDYAYYNEYGFASLSSTSVQLYQARLKHHLQLNKWHWHGDAVFQNSSSDILPLSKILLNQKLYWQAKVFKEATEMQIGLSALHRSSHPGMSYSPLLGNVYLNPAETTAASTRLALFANFQIQTVKVFMSFENLNGLWQEQQYLLKPYPLPKSIFRLSLIWNFYD